jgi:cell wall-active antibiotic response 4TMS protein YvqF
VSVRVYLLATAFALCAGDVAAQSMRPFSTFRQWHGETRLTARLEYAAGTLRVGPGRADELYRMDLSYDEDRFLPVSDFDASGGEVMLGLAPAGGGGVRVVSQNQLRQTAGVAFSPKADLALEVKLGAVDGELELGGLRVANLDFSAGASRAAVRFSRLNGTRCRSATLSAGAAELTVSGLGNSRCDRIAFDGGVGSVTLDFGGAWTSSSQVEVKMALGEVTLRLPRQVGVNVTLDKFLSSFDPEGLERRGNSYRSRGYEQAARHLDISVSTAAGAVRVEWSGERGTGNGERGTGNGER